jgi:tRNA A-37 threonylcarbamoyl transferase component Bud32
MTVIKGLYSTCEIIDNERVIKKYYNDPLCFELCDNELKWYKRFKDLPDVLPHTPKLLDHYRDTLVLEYVGHPITKDAVPVNFKNQLRQIASFLKHHHCYHCDITPSNLLVFNTTIFLIDFGWAVEMDEDPFRKWIRFDKPTLGHIGSDYRAHNWPNDKYSLTKIYNEFSGKKNKKLFH